MAKAETLRGGDRVSIDKDVHDLYKELTEKSNKYPENAPFYLMKDVFMWSVALGVHAGKRKKLKKREQIFRWDQLSQDIDIPVLRAISIAETEDVEIIAQEGQILRIAEEYANEGIRILKRDVIGKAGKIMWNIVDFLRKVD